MNRQINNLSYLKPYRRNLRNNGTTAEAVLWMYIKHSQLEGRKFRRQHSVGNYILDFYCPSERINVELDGAHHYTAEGTEHDRIRDQFLKELRITVIRIENREVFENTEMVLDLIKSYFKKRT